jgi:HTH-type transcriptional regulator / antitoxin HigA
MIKNERQYRITKKQAQKLKDARVIAMESKDNLPKAVFKSMIAGLGSQIMELEESMDKYEKLSDADSLNLGSAEDIGKILIEARIARGYSQKKLAGLLKLKPQQIQAYEARNYRSASLKRILDIMAKLNIDIEADINLKAR